MSPCLDAAHISLPRIKVAVVIDFDSIRITPPLTDLANGTLQFSIMGGRPNPSDWPDYFDHDKLRPIPGRLLQRYPTERKKSLTAE
jgi:hypothetical protein